MISYCIFCERVWDDEKFKLLKEFVEKKIQKPATLGFGGPYVLNTEKVKLFVVTPANYYLAIGEQGYQGTKKEFEKILLERYKELELMGCRLHLHLHLAMVPEGINQDAMFKEATAWMRTNDFKPEFITFGWYIFNEESLRLAEKYKLSFFNDRFHFSLHDYELDPKHNIFKPMLILNNIRGLVR